MNKLTVNYLGLLMPLLSRESPIRISAPLSLWGDSWRLVTLTENTLCVLPRSSLHQALKLWPVSEHEPWLQALARFPSIALFAMPVEWSVDCVAFPWSARFSPVQRAQFRTSALRVFIDAKHLVIVMLLMAVPMKIFSFFPKLHNYDDMSNFYMSSFSWQTVKCMCRILRDWWSQLSGGTMYCCLFFSGEKTLEKLIDIFRPELWVM